MKRALVALVLAVAGSAHAQPREPDLKIDAAVRSQVIDAALAALQGRYVFPDVAAKIETSIRDRVKAHAYDRLTSAAGFAEALTKDLQAVSHDKHMRVFYRADPVPDDPPPDGEPPEAEKARFHAMAQRTNAAFVKVERLDVRGRSHSSRWSTARPAPLASTLRSRPTSDAAPANGMSCRRSDLDERATEPSLFRDRPQPE